jgi:multicomponent Na+:H+ antiporter subunit E
MSGRFPTSSVLAALWLTAVWALLWGSAAPGTLLAGLVLGSLLVLVVPLRRDRGGGVHPVAVVRYGMHFAWALVTATASVAATILRPRMQLDEGIVAVPMRARSPVVVTFVANSISLTPGTLTVDLRPRAYGLAAPTDRPDEPAGDASAEDAPPVLYVHCLVVGDVEDVRRDARRFEELAIAAFGSASDRDALRTGTPTEQAARAEPTGEVSE